MMFLAEQVRQKPDTLMQVVGANPELFFFRVSTIATTLFLFIRVTVIELVRSIFEIMDNFKDAEGRKEARRKRRQ